MKLSRTVPSILLAATFLLAPAAKSAGMIVIDPVGPMPHPIIAPMPVPIHPGPGPRPTRPVLKGNVSFGLRLQAADVKVDIVDQVAKTYITQTFINDTDQNLAGTYLFPLPEDTTFSSFSLHIDGKPVEGKILEANEARQTYEDIVRRLVDPGLLEYADYKTVRARIFPIPAHGTKKVELEYTQLLKAENGLLKYSFPLKTENDSAPAEEIKVNVKLNSKQGLRTIWSPSHTITSERKDDHEAKVSYAGKDTVPDKDFFLYYSVSDKDLVANLITKKNSSEDGYFLMTLSPPVESKEIIGKDIILVADSSGSMQGQRMDQNKQALKFLINALNETDRFNIIHFDTDVDAFKSNVLDATPENKKAALAYIDDLEARGGTNIGDALKMATKMLDVETTRPGYLVLMTDGEPTVGETSVSGLVKLVEAKRDIRVFDFGVGYDINTKLLNKLAEEHHGTAQYVEPDESIETSLSSFYQKIKSPVMSNVKIAYDNIQVKDVYPRDVKDIFAGSQVMLLGKYKNSGDATIKLTGTVNGVEKAMSFPLKFAAEETGHTYLPRLWAMRRIGHLSQVAQENGNTKEVVDEILELSRKHGIISAYSSFLVTDPNEVDAHGNTIGAWTTGHAGGPGWGGGVARRGGGGGGGVDFGGGFFAADDRAMAPEAGTVMPRTAMGKIQRQAGAAFMPPPPAVSLATSAVTRLDAMVASVGAGDAVYGDEGTHGAPPYSEFDFVSTEMSKSIASAATTGKGAIRREKKLGELAQATAVEESEKSSAVKSVEDKTFYLRDGFWTDAAFNTKTSPKVEEVTFGSKEYFELLKTPGISKFLSVGRQVIFVFNGKTYKVTYKENA